MYMFILLIVPPYDWERVFLIPWHVVPQTLQLLALPDSSHMCAGAPIHTDMPAPKEIEY